MQFAANPSKGQFDTVRAFLSLLRSESHLRHVALGMQLAGNITTADGGTFMEARSDLVFNGQ